MKTLMRLFLAIHVGLYRLTSGRVGGRMFGGDVLILTTTGRKSGRRRDTPVMYVRDPATGGYVVVASNGGSPSHPAWYLNARAAGTALVQVGGQQTAVGVREAQGEERERLWALAVTGFAGFDNYRQKTTRHIPVLVLTPEA